MKHMMHSYHGKHEHRDDDALSRSGRESILDAVGWGAFFVWVGCAWLAGFELGYILLGIGLLTLAVQGARRLLGLRLEGFWLLVGCGFFAAGYWELWNVGIPLAPIVLIAAGLGLIGWQVLRRRH